VKHYRSSIPKAARERVASTYEPNRAKHKAEYVLDGRIVGLPSFGKDGFEWWLNEDQKTVWIESHFSRTACSTASGASGIIDED
jgi:hypothetical protein